MTSPAVPEPFRCRRGKFCEDKEPVRDPVTGDHLGWRGSDLVDHADGLCQLCVSKVAEALDHLPGDVADLTRILGKPLNGAPREHVGGTGPGPSLPIQVGVEALRHLIDREVCYWAKSVADDAGVTWSTLKEHHSRIGHRVQMGCQLLRFRLRGFLDLGIVEHRARSLGIRRDAGHSVDTTTRYADDYWTRRDGLTGAVLLLNLHRRAWREAQRHDTPIPVQGHCPGCYRPALLRWPGEGNARCGHCRHPVPEDYLDRLKAMAGRCRSEADVAVLEAALVPTG